MSKIRESKRPVNPDDNGQPRPDDAKDATHLTGATAGPGTGGAAEAPVGKADDPPPPTRSLVPGIDLDACGEEEDYQEGMAADESPATVVVHKPAGHGYFRTHPILFRNVRMLEVKNGPDRGYYLVAHGARAVLQSDENDDVRLFRARLTLCFSRDTGLFLWPLRLPESRKENQIDEWSQSALRICKEAESGWVKLYTRKGGSCYSFRPGKGIKTEPTWPSITLKQACDLAFEGRYLTDPRDPLIRRLLGEE
jgi:hypothetical protein